MSSLVLALLLACGAGRADPPEPASEPGLPVAVDAAPATPPAAAALLPAVPPTVGGKAPVYVHVFTHHYRGQGGYYPSAAEVREIARACVDQGMASLCTLFFDGLLAARLSAEDPSLGPWLHTQGFPIGYHGEEAHGPHPVVVSVQQVKRNGRAVEQLVQPGWTFAQAIEGLHARYVQAFERPEWGPDGYLRRGVGGQTQAGTVGGIRRVADWLDRKPEIMPGHALFQPAALFAFAPEAELALLQGAGPFAAHFLAGSKNPELIEATRSFLGVDSSLFWFMGQLVEKGKIEERIPAWSTEGFAQRAAPPGGGPGKARGPAAGGRAPGTGPSPGGPRPPKNPDGSWPGAPSGGGAASGEAGTAAHPPAFDEELGTGEGAPGEAMQAAFARLDRRVPGFVQVSIGGTYAQTRDALAWLAAEQARDPGLRLLRPSALRGYVEPPEILLSATETARAVLSGWEGGPPDSLWVEGQAASLADAFEVLARHLAGEGDQILTSAVNGPTGLRSELPTATGEVGAAEVVAAAPGVLRAIEDSPWHAIPTTVQVGRTPVGFHQYLHLMAEVVAQGPDGRHALQPDAYSPPYALLLAGMLGEGLPDQSFWMQCQFWTARPVTWRE